MKKKVVIIGSGISGISAAIYLDKEKYDVTVLEKNLEPGGKIKTNYINGNTCEIGALYIVAKTNSKLLQLLQLNNIKSEQLFEYLYIIDDKPVIKIPPADQLNLIFKMNNKMCALAETIDFNIDHPEYYMSAREFAIQQDVLLLYKFIEDNLKHYGYSGLSECLAISFLLYFKSIGTKVQKISNELGLTDILNKLINCFNINVRLNTNIISINRDTKIITLESNEEVTYDILIMATDLKNIPNLYSCSELETEIFNSTVNNPGISYNIEALNNFDFLKVKLTNNDLNIYSFGFKYPGKYYGFSTAGNNIFYIYMKQDFNLSIDEHTEILKQELKPLFGDIIIHDAKAWTHQNSPTNEAIVNGFYGKVTNMQGYKDTYYAGEAFTYALLSSCHDYAEMIVNKYLNVKEI